MISSTDSTNANNICSALTLLILMTRLSLSKLQQKPMDLSFFICLFALCCVTARIPITHYVLQYGTASDIAAKLKLNPKILETTNLAHVRIGSILSLTTRILLTSVLWSMNLVLLLLYRRFIAHLPWMKHAITASWIFMAVSYIAVVAATFLECRPFSLWWQIQPSPGTCVKAYYQTVIQCVSNIVVDVVLMLISVPLLFIQGSSVRQKMRIGGLISLGLFCIIVTCLRLGYIFVQGSLQPTRSFWGSIQLLMATAVANAPVLYGSVNLFKRKGKTSYGYGATGPQTGTARVTGQQRTMFEEEKDGVIVKQTVVTLETDKV
ncbi:hypothetical protein BDZ85DRAFT_313418 [Elsinoe ampelina]|uniref:Rhodopsin domain-containing protein n=1 Tax=Elsinoe ampelina TaxID=302913 RepID=A0A6A6G9T0_9PEZI|nr:hypothetical protein BDZ85DRAFT_313418 [Elsinoe ampelina]